MIFFCVYQNSFFSVESIRGRCYKRSDSRILLRLSNPRSVGKLQRATSEWLTWKPSLSNDDN